MSDSQSFSLRMSAAEHRALKALSYATGESMNTIIMKGVTEALKNAPQWADRAAGKLRDDLLTTLAQSAETTTR